MTRPKLLLTIGEGIGNIIEALPLIATLEGHGFDVDIFITHANIPIPNNLFKFNTVFQEGDDDNIDIAKYDGRIDTIWGAIHTKENSPIKKLKRLNNLRSQKITNGRSDIKTYLTAASDLGIPQNQFIYYVRHLLTIPPTTSHKESPDVVICNGYNRTNIRAKWVAKSYPYWEEVAKRLKECGYRVCSTGLPDDYVPGTINKTGISLDESIQLLVQANILLANDTGLYHLACALEVPVVVVFTFTDLARLYDVDFHRTATVIQKSDIECRNTCQQQMRWINCNDWKCRQIHPDVIFSATRRLLINNNIEGEQHG